MNEKKLGTMVPMKPSKTTLKRNGVNYLKSYSLDSMYYKLTQA